MTTGSAIADRFQLPGGVVLGDNRRLSTAVLRSLTGHEEEWLASNPGSPSAVRTTYLLHRCLSSLDDTPVTVDLVRRMLVGDRDYLVLQLRRLTIGDDVHAVAVCPACNGKMDLNFRAAEVPVTVRPQTEAWYTHKLSDRAVRFRLPTGGDQEKVLEMTDEAASQNLFHRCILDDGGKAIQPEEREAIIDSMESLAPLLDLEFDMVCPDCQHVFVLPFDTTAYFFEEVETNRKQLLREVHTLALYYHWSETEILELRRDRRHAYLDLLNEALRPD